MHRRYGAVLGAATAAAVTAALVAPLSSATAEPGNARPAQPSVTTPGSDHRELGPDYKLSNKPERAVRPSVGKQLRGAPNAARTPVVGAEKIWPYLDYIPGTWDLQPYTLRGIGDHIQLWVANSTAFPEGDCRNDLGLATITDAQVQRFITEFDENIYPKESKAFSVPPALDGTNALAPQYVEDMPADYYKGTPDEAGDTIVLVDNVKDENYFEPGSPDGQTYVAGFFTSTFNLLTDRNVMTIDAFDWKHRTGATVTDDSEDAAYVACTEELGQQRPLGAARPRLYEGTFAHEYQHLLESYESPGEHSWVNEGLSDYAQTLVGYVDTRIPPNRDDADGHIGCFDGYLGRSFGGPENSLTMWEDQGGPEVLCDYGAAYTFMMYLRSHYGAKFMSALHREDVNGMKGLNKVLDRFGAEKSAMATIRDWAATIALDAALDRSHDLTGGDWKTYTAASLSNFINWRTPQAYASPGAPPNGSDYVRFKKGSGWMKASQLKSLRFKGAKTLAPDPVEWVLDTTPPTATVAGDSSCGTANDGTGAAAIYSGCGTDLDRSVVREVAVPAGGATLSFDALWDTEALWDYGYVQVSTDGGATWTSLATEDTITNHDPEANPLAIANLPGLNGDSGGWKTQTADLSAYAGKTVLLGFRYITDGAVDEAGFWVRNVTVGDTALPTDTLAGWKSITQVNPVEIKGWTLQLLAIRKSGAAWIERVKVNDSFQARLGRKALHKALGERAGLVAALVMVDDPSESLTKYGRYKLTVNRKLQPGG